MNDYSDSQNPDQDTTPIFPKVKMTSQPLQQQAAASVIANMSSGASELARSELNLLSKLIGTDVSGQSNSQGTFKLNIVNPSPEDSKEKKESEPIADDFSGPLKIDMKGSGRRRDHHLEQIVGEMTVEEQNADNDEDLLALMDKAL